MVYTIAITAGNANIILQYYDVLFSSSVSGVPKPKVKHIKAPEKIESYVIPPKGPLILTGAVS